MKTFKFDQHELGLYEPSDSEIKRKREAARAVLCDERGRIAVMHFTTTGSYKLPGGGIDEGEEITAALRREIREETGYTIENIDELCTYEELRYAHGLHQISYCFTARANEFVGTELTPKEAAEGMELRWAADYDEAIAWVDSSVNLDNDGSQAGLAMMKLRDTTILKLAKNLSDKK